MECGFRVTGGPKFSREVQGGNVGLLPWSSSEVPGYLPTLRTLAPLPFSGTASLQTEFSTWSKPLT